MSSRQTAKRKRKRRAISVLGVAGLSMALAGGASATGGGVPAHVPSQSAAVSHQSGLREEEVSDVSLATFHVFDGETAGQPQPRLRLAGCGCAAGCAGCGGCGCPCGTGFYYHYTPPVFGGHRSIRHRRPARPAHKYRHSVKGT